MRQGLRAQLVQIGVDRVAGGLQVGAGDAQRQGQIAAELGQRIGVGIAEATGHALQERHRGRPGELLQLDRLDAGQNQLVARGDEQRRRRSRDQALDLLGVRHIVEQDEDATAVQRGMIVGDEAVRLDVFLPRAP